MTKNPTRQEALIRVANTFVLTTDCESAEKSFDFLMSLGLYAEGLCLLICGESGVGKSTLVRWLIRNLKSGRNAQGETRTAAYVELPTAPTAIGVFEAILAALGDPKPSQGTRPVKKRRLIKMLKDIGVKLLVLDDLQHIIDRKSDRILFDASEAIKEVLIAYPMSVLCAGLADAERVVKSNEQLSRRHMSTVRIQRFNWNKKASKASFMKVLNGFQKGLSAYDLPDLQNESVALRFYLATGGVMDFLFKIFLFAAQIALNRNLKAIGLSVFHEAWKIAFLHSESGEQSFQEKFDDMNDVKERVERAMQINAPPPATSLRKNNAKSRLKGVGL